MLLLSRAFVPRFLFVLYSDVSYSADMCDDRSGYLSNYSKCENLFSFGYGFDSGFSQMICFSSLCEQEQETAIHFIIHSIHRFLKNVMRCASTKRELPTENT
jgi:hypothetical protein